MPFKRLAPSNPSRPSPEPSKRRKDRKSAKIYPEIQVYVVQAKIDGHVLSELFRLAERHCKRLLGDVEDADVVITAVTMRKRLERHIPWEVAKTKAVVTPAWLRDSAAEGRALPCELYVALQDLRECTIKNWPVYDNEPRKCKDTEVEGAGAESHYLPPSASSTSTRTVLSERELPSQEKSKFARVSLRSPESERESLATAHHIPPHLLPPALPIPTSVSLLNHASKYACQRASPLVCPNQALAVELGVIKRSRALEGEERSALSYSRAISTIFTYKAYPRHITSVHQIADIPHIGPKLTALVQEYLDSGKIKEARTIASSERFAALSTFSEIYGIGPPTARRLYDLGLRTSEDLDVYFDADPEEGSQLVEIDHHENLTQDREAGLGETWIKISLGLRKDFGIKIPRAEVEEMDRVVMHELSHIQPGCVSTIVGGHRRGKPESNDVDIVFTHPDPDKSKGLCKRLVKRLHEQGMVTHVMHLSGFHGHNSLRTAHWDSLEKALTVFVLPPSSPYYKGRRRRLDLIFAQPEVYWCAVVGWSGSIMFQRDLRQWAKDKVGMKFDSSGITRLYDSKPYYPNTEKEVFDLLGLEWVGPTWRNADL